MVQIIDFGDNCLPYVLSKDILGLKQPTLFSLGVYPFNNILHYLKDGNYEDIIKTDLLTYNKTRIQNFSNKVTGYKHSNIVVNLKYNFTFNHHFSYDFSDNCIDNYGFVSEQFTKRIYEFKEALQNEKTLIFANFSNYANMKNMKIDEMIITLNNLINKKYYIFIFFFGNKFFEECDININYIKYCKNTFDKHNNVKIIFLKNDFTNWWLQEKTKKDVLFDEIKKVFFTACNDINVDIYEKTG